MGVFSFGKIRERFWVGDSTLEQATHMRSGLDGLVHHSDRGSQYLTIRYTDRLEEAGISQSVGSVGDSYDNALAETVNALYKAELIHRRKQWESVEEVEAATLDWVAWYNERRLHGALGDIPPAEFERSFGAGYPAPKEMALN